MINPLYLYGYLRYLLNAKSHLYGIIARGHAAILDVDVRRRVRELAVLVGSGTLTCNL